MSNSKTNSEAYWHDISKSGYPDEHGLYLAILQYEFPYGVEVETVQYFKEGQLLYILSGEDYDQHVTTVRIDKDGFYQGLPDELPDRMFEELPVTYWMPIPKLPDRYIHHAKRLQQVPNS